MLSEEYIKLYQKYVSGKCTPEEEKKLFNYQDSFKMWPTNVSDEDRQQEKLQRRKIYQRIAQTVSSNGVKVRSLWFRYAAAVFIILSVGIVFFVNNVEEQQKIETHLTVKKKIIADSSGVMLTLSDGSVISLDNESSGLLSEEGSVKINKTKDGDIIYEANSYSINQPVSLNKLYIPKGMQYKLKLSDGTSVWLNANSTLSYPSSFKGDEREVELSGEAYFEVAKNDKMPFIVKTRETRVRVLGTHFNISAYAGDDFEKTTLLEGSVKVSHSTQSVILKPGQQGVIEELNKDIKVKEVDLQRELAWKDGYFIFKDDNIKDVMKQISRWYDVDVAYETTAQGKSFGGIYSRSKELEELLKGLELTGTVKFRIEGGKIYVTD